jgi:hypothetical protein
MKQREFIQDIYAIVRNYDGDGNGLSGETHEEVVELLKADYPALFKAYEMLGKEKDND